MAKIGGKSHLVDVEVSLKHETDKAWLVHTGDPDDAKWIPKSQAELEEGEGNNIFILTLPDWLAYEEGLI